MAYSFGIIILVGGHSSRFGQDKGLYVWQGQPIIAHMLNALGILDFPFCLVAFDDGQVAEYQDVVSSVVPNLEFVTNAFAPPYPPDVRAPIIGAAAGLQYFSGKVDAAFLFSCDVPLISPQVVSYLASIYAGQDALLPCWVENDFLEPLHALYNVEQTLPRAQIAIEKQKWKLLRLIWGSDSWLRVPIEAELQPLDPALGTFANFNYVEDLENLSARKGK
jgi:molybdopterin-guanine dinucleotide biosynthesis protein A